MDDSLRSCLIDYVCLLYHEARNVRHPLKAGKLPDDSKYAELTSLPVNRNHAWDSMKSVREKADVALSAAEVVHVFHSRYGLTLAGLQDLYNDSCWRDSAFGGNKWAPICTAVRQLVEAADAGDTTRTRELLENIPQIKHNTGTVGKKLLELQNYQH